MSERAWVVVIDDNADAAGVVGDHLRDRRVFGFDDAESAARFLIGDRSLHPGGQGLPDPPSALVLVDLWMGPRRPNGLHTLATLRQVDRLPITAMLRSAETDDGRELLAIAAAEVWSANSRREGIPYLAKDCRRNGWEATASLLADMDGGADELASRAQGSFGGFRWIRPLDLTDDRGRTTSFLQWLASPGWKLPFLRSLAQGASFREARKESGAPKAPRDIWARFAPVLQAHHVRAQDGSWLSHNGTLDVSDVALGGRSPVVAQGDFMAPLVSFATKERFLVGDPGLPALIKELCDNAE
jgi:hypothetical protein